MIPTHATSGIDQRVEQNKGRDSLLAKIEPVQKLFQPPVLIIIPTIGFIQRKENTNVVFMLDHMVHLTKKRISSLYDCAV